jgi:hypothetical protein
MPRNLAQEYVDSALEMARKWDFDDLIGPVSESDGIIKLFFRSTIAQNYCCGYTTSDRSGGLLLPEGTPTHF